MSDKFEHKAQALLGSIELEPSEAVWQHVKREITPEKRKRRFVFWWILPVVLTAGLVYYMGSRSNNIHTPQTAQRVPVQPEVQGNRQVSTDNTTQRVTQNKRGNEKTIITKNKKQLKPVKTGSSISYSNAKRKTHYQKNSQSEPLIAEANTNAEISHPQPAENIGVTSNKTLTDSAVADKQISQPKETAKENIYDTTKSATAIVVNKPRHNGWQFGLLAEGGLATPVLTGSSMSLYTNGTITSAVAPSFIYEKRQVSIGSLFSMGFAANRSVAKKTDVHTSLAYMYQSFSIKNILYKDSLNTHNIISQSTSSYRAHYINLSIGGTLYFSEKGMNRMGVAASMDNMYMLAANNSIASVSSISSPTANFQKTNSLASYNKWQPHINLGFIASFTTNNKTLVQLSPYIRYSLRPFETAQQRNNRLISVGLSTRYFFR